MNKIWAITKRHWKPLLGFNLLVIGVTMALVASSAKVWRARTQLILPDTSSNLDANLGTLGSFRNSNTVFSSSQVNPLKVQASILTSDALLEQVLAADPEKEQFGSLGSYRRLFSASPQEQSTIISLAVSGSSPEIAQQRAIAFIEVYQRRLNELRRADSTTREQFNQRELDQAREQLHQAQSALANFQQSSGLVNSEEQTRGIVATINTLMTAKAQAEAQAQAHQNRIRALSERLNLTPVQAVRSLGLSENVDYQAVRSQLSQVEADLVKAQASFTNRHPQVIDLMEQRQQLQRQLQRYVAQAAAGANIDTTVASDRAGRASLIQQLILAETEASAQQRQATALQSQINQLSATLQSIPPNQARLLELRRQYDVAEGVYKGLVAQLKQSNLDAFNAYPNVQVLDPPRVDPKPISPKRSIAALHALIASAIGSVALVLLLEARNPLLSPKDLQTIAFPLVVQIPHFRHPSLELTLTDETEVPFQRLASSISLQSLPTRRLLIASAIEGEGKTTVTLGLAIALADLGFKVLLVDGDFRQAELSRYLGYEQDPIANQQPVSLQPSIDFLPNQPRKSKIVELMTRGRFEQVLSMLQSDNDYDYVLVDSAPVSLTSETALMATLVPNVLFIVRPGMSKRNPVRDSLDQLRQHHAQIVGLVVNGTETKNRAYPYRVNDSVVNS